MKKTKIIALALSLVTLLTVATGCPLTKSWHDKAKEAVAEKLKESNAGEFWLNGSVYQFPCPLQDFIDDGWSLNNKIDPADKKLDAYTKSKCIYELKKDEDIIVVGVTNNTSKAIDFEDSEVDLLQLDIKSGKVVTAGDLELFYTKFDDADDFYDYLLDEDEFAVEETKDGIDNVYFFQGNNDYSCSVTFTVSESQDAYRVNNIEFQCIYSKSRVEEVDAVIKSVKSDDSSYINDTVATMILEENPDFNAVEFITGEKEYLCDVILYLLGFEFTYYDMSPATQSKLMAYVEFLLSEATYTLSEGDNEDLVVMEYTAVNFEEEAYAAYDAADLVYEKDISESYSDEEYFNLFVDALIANEPNASYLSNTYIVDYNYEYAFDDTLTCLIGLQDFI